MFGVEPNNSLQYRYGALFGAGRIGFAPFVTPGFGEQPLPSHTACVSAL